MAPKKVDAAAELNQMAMTLLTLARDNKFKELEGLASVGMPITLGNQARDAVQMTNHVTPCVTIGSQMCAARFSS
eukprot:1154299-Pelagomonas_calceolata.AAC.5